MRLINHQLRVSARLTEIQKQKIDKRAPPRNRYYRGAKLSEHKFLRILDGYAHGEPLAALEPTTHVTGKTIRAMYGTLRANLPGAVQRDRARFAEAGRYLFADDAVSADGRRILARIEKTRRFARYIQRHAPRANSDEQERLLLLDKAVRIFCALDLRGVEVGERLLSQIAEAFTGLRLSEPLDNIADSLPNVRKHAHPCLRFYEDYRRHLLKNPLGDSSLSPEET